MRYTINVKELGSIKVWIDDDLKMRNIKAGEQHVNRNFYGRLIDEGRESIRIIVECRFCSHNSSYGLLGLEYLPTAGNDSLDVDVFYLSHDKEVALKDGVHAGLPEYALEVVFEELSRFVENNKNLSAGKLSFLYAASSPGCSSSGLYRILIRILFDILCFNKKHIDQEVIFNIVKKNGSIRGWFAE